MVSLITIKTETERAPLVVDPKASVQLLGPASTRGDLADYGFSPYEKLVFSLTFDAADVGKQVAVRFNVNSVPGNVQVKIEKITLLATGTTCITEIKIKNSSGWKNRRRG